MKVDFIMMLTNESVDIAAVSGEERMAKTGVPPTAADEKRQLCWK